ncbi:MULTISPECIES: GGDEF domain-containing protein [Actinoalloteichus]|uniref:Diguanylate cyclase (GGDEF) domain-containing protein n=1 Tax=Actinoalloteichus caeruleus DSM 43889 TaxID=1120930 RepID=A0ABT1JKZ7_ACTCY|nr:tetratricopeptide repeat-containing diguanylate cyclase [Actinoalloteichus caeruleus]MCP2332411.1 diguanylate cyclase (GGDEF) domain-containing protein [Actinoalloteichus caeruleus DSM 43889]
MLRAASVVRLVTKGHEDRAVPLLDELVAHTRRHGLLALEADAHALRGRASLAFGEEDAALTEAAVAMAMLDEKLSPDPLMDRRTWQRLLSTALSDVALVLTQLGVYELADEVMARAHEHIRSSGGPHHISVHLINRTRMLLGWGLRLERANRYEEATDRYALASAIAVSVEGPWRDSLHPRARERPAAEQVPVVGAAHALARPSPDHVEPLRLLHERCRYPRELIIVSLALCRCLEADGREAEALEVLAQAREEVSSDPNEPPLWLSLAREFARLCGPEDGEAATLALEQYNAALEDELWTLRETRLGTLQTRREHERLTRKHGAMARQALQDPLTGLANRRALDEELDSLIRTPQAYPLAVALCDLDGFKGVNDRCSHAEGDDVLRVVASTLRDALRADDTVARYGGDEFVVLLPGSTLEEAEIALNRAVRAVAALPHDLSRGVTLSIGVVATGDQESGGQVLARADSAMYQAKRGGGSQVFTAGPTGESVSELTTELWEPPSG